MSQHLQEPVFKPKNVPAKNAQNPLEILASLFLKANLLLYLLPPYITQTYKIFLKITRSFPKLPTDNLHKNV